MLTEKTLFKEDRIIESDSDVLNNMINNDLNSFKIVNSGNGFDKSYESMKKHLNKYYTQVTIIESNNSNQIQLNSYSVIFNLFSTDAFYGKITPL